MFQLLFDVIKMRLASIYFGGIEEARRVFAAGVLSVCLALVGLAGFLMCHGALFILLPFETTTKAIVFLLLGAVYVVVALSLVFALCSPAKWRKELSQNRLGRWFVSEQPVSSKDRR